MTPGFSALLLLAGFLAWQTASAQADLADATLLYARATDGECSIGVWHAATGESRERLRIDSCPENLFTSADASSAFVVDAAKILTFSPGAESRVDEFPLPDLDYQKWAPSSEVVMHPGNVAMLDTTTMQAAGIGLLSDGSVGIHLMLSGPADDSVNFLLRRAGDSWTLIEGRLCGRWEFPCVFESLNMVSSDVWLWPQERQILSPNIAGNIYLTGGPTPIAEPGVADSEGEIRKLSFRIDGRDIEVIFDTTPSAHFDHDYTMAIDLAIDGAHVANLSRNQCMTSLNGRYLLVREFFGGRYEMTDVGTGKTMIGALNAAIWLD